MSRPPIPDQLVRDSAGPVPLGFDSHVFCVPAGTDIEHQGRILTVTETAVVWLGNRVYCTERVFNKIQAATRARLS